MNARVCTLPLVCMPSRISCVPCYGFMIHVFFLNLSIIFLKHNHYSNARNQPPLSMDHPVFNHAENFSTMLLCLHLVHSEVAGLILSTQNWIRRYMYVLSITNIKCSNYMLASKLSLCIYLNQH